MKKELDEKGETIKGAKGEKGEVIIAVGHGLRDTFSSLVLQDLKVHGEKGEKVREVLQDRRFIWSRGYWTSWSKR